MRSKRTQAQPVATHCMHGYSEKLRNCAICHHEPGQCDYGDCQAKAVGLFERRDSAGKRVEAREFCEHHASESALLVGAPVYRVSA